CSSSGGTPAFATCARGGSAWAAASSPGADARERDGAACVLRARAGRLARLRNAPASALHGLASFLRGDRRGDRAALAAGHPRARAARILPRDGGGRACPRRAQRTAAADE